MGEAERGAAPARDALVDAGLGSSVEDRCMRCDRLIEGDRIKIIPPRYVQDRDPYVRAGLVRRRVMCIGCYNRLDGNRISARFARGPDLSRKQ